MGPWLWLVLGVTVSVLGTWSLLWRLDQRQTRQSALLSAALAAAEQEIRQSLVRISDTLQTLVTADTTRQQAQDGLFLGAFLPTDETAAQMERQILSSEDRAIAASGLSRPSRASHGRSQAVGSTPLPRRAGRAS